MMKQLPAVLLLAACSTNPIDLPIANPTPIGANDTCSAGQYARLIGADVTALERVLILGQVRVVRRDTMVTMDFRPERINFMIKTDETIAQITCG